ncbi:3-hydroxyisobutyrate dehydrogenase [Vibrio nigripulchritudo SFn27]|uniref:3-hydroxyisobutyrate dehydrogenase n=1 Tax=Vibrio nigripulchritudo TaxID=28173 RepID=U4KA57_9VIBR|nr:3-hydroxyisobutyrate dehydrogenase [Vibrio nigripulchritudo]CCN83830.1 3-hydroxyisobutyrate dehydrogenase [Vibrio nigripulchritudo BLFn1]CCN87162.1 3-hydroxyisobutyrate dehydrogenase [Vibrio nigripulchritudo SFn27]CCN94518.1 3-hydroxyisobutyrate dehydrogenase [Vibrio nigripulchritudo ENn2]CCO40916.1 3-hydroxyisobutyrate dehydrogenase [Vibrio nigripulchritudo SFn135]CCO54995.1 3-hydroxyisobutyrate dehydrogenase [Vibrio nigripulchritudo Wn13]
MKKIAFLGLGNMGAPMASNLVAKGNFVTAFDLSKKALETAANEGCNIASSAPEAIQNAEIVISMLPASKHVGDLYHSGNSPLFEILPENTLVIDCSTIDAETARFLATKASNRNIDFIDAPVSGGVAGAQSGTLTFIVGGSESQFERAKPVLNSMGRNIFHAGDHGAGQVAKVCNNMLLAILMAGTCEALNMGIKAGLNAEVLSAIMQQSSGNNWALQVYNPVPGVMKGVPASRKYRGGFQVDLMLKDLRLALETATHHSAKTPMGKKAHSMFSEHQLTGNGTLDFSSLFQHYNKV